MGEMANWYGHSDNIWRDNWLPFTNLSSPFPTATHIGPLPTMVHSLIDPDTRDWNLESIANIIESSTATLIKAIPLGNLGCRDQLIWPWNKSGCYTVRSGYHWAMSHMRGVSNVS